jgi:hypothetical protein
MARSAAYIAVGAAGGYSLVKRLLIDPVLRPLAKRAPVWAQPLFAVVFYIFDRKTSVQEAEEAGQKAVEEKPAEGMGSVKDVE